MIMEYGWTKEQMDAQMNRKLRIQNKLTSSQIALNKQEIKFNLNKASLL